MYPLLRDQFALRQIGDTFYYLINSRNGDYYELDQQQTAALRLADGIHTIQDIADLVSAPYEDVLEFFREQESDEILDLGEQQEKPLVPHYRKSEPPHLSDVLIEVTGRCNLRCSHCYNSLYNTEQSAAAEMSRNDVLALIGELDELNCRRIQLSGGEALLRDDLWELIDSIDAHRIFLDVISTNATLINESNIGRFLERFGDRGALYVSMDGLSAETYELIRGEGTFAQFQRSMELLSHGGCRMFINTMAIRQNLSELHTIYDWVAQNPAIKGWRIGMPKVLGRYQEYHKLMEVEFSQVIAVFKELLARWLTDRPDFRLELSDFFRTDSFETGMERHLATDHPCKYAMTNCTIKPDGAVVFCASLEIHEPARLGNFREHGLAHIWYGDRHRRIRELTVEDIEYCKDCRYTILCGGGCRGNALLSVR